MRRRIEREETLCRRKAQTRGVKEALETRKGQEALSVWDRVEGASYNGRNSVEPVLNKIWSRATKLANEPADVEKRGMQQRMTTST
uniref:Uncharacterized protein n=1 Tax=Steinernema glaseri TaxID=37863 RepID=A0A1I7ZUJ9_9BILA